MADPINVLINLLGICLLGLSAYTFGSKIYEKIFFHTQAAKEYKKAVAFQSEPALLFIDRSNMKWTELILYASTDRFIVFNPETNQKIKTIMYSKINRIVVRLFDDSKRFRSLNSIKRSAEDILYIYLHCSDKKQSVYDFDLLTSNSGREKNKYALTHGDFFTKVSEHVKNIEVI